MNYRFELAFISLCTTLFIVGWMLILTSSQQPTVVTNALSDQSATTMAVDVRDRLYADRYIDF